MSVDIARSVRREVTSAGVHAAWAQWASLTAAALPVTERRVWTIVDPEALILLSLRLQREEPRLAEIVSGFAEAAGSLISVTRLKTLALSSNAGAHLHAFATAAKRGGHRQWQTLASANLAAAGPAKDVGMLRLIEGPSLMLRLRAGFGVTAKADLLAYLLGIHAAADLKVMRISVGYSDRALRTAAEEMALAGFIERIDGFPVTYRAETNAWANLLQLYQLDTGAQRAPAIPPWDYWSRVFAFFTATLAWADNVQQKALTGYVASSRARDLFDRYLPVLSFTGIPVKSAEHVRGADFLVLFHDVVRQFVTRANEHLHRPPPS